jgi:hypothetical protein
MDQFLLPPSDNIRHTSFSLTKNFSFNMYLYDKIIILSKVFLNRNTVI